MITPTEDHKRKEPTPVLFKTVAAFCQERSMSRATFYREVAAGRIRPVKRGRRTLIRNSEAERYDDGLPALA